MMLRLCSSLTYLATFLGWALWWGPQGSILDSNWGEWERLGPCVVGEQSPGPLGPQASESGFQAHGLRVQQLWSYPASFAWRLQSQEAGK